MTVTVLAFANFVYYEPREGATVRVAPRRPRPLRLLRSFGSFVLFDHREGATVRVEPRRPGRLRLLRGFRLGVALLREEALHNEFCMEFIHFVVALKGCQPARACSEFLRGFRVNKSNRFCVVFVGIKTGMSLFMCYSRCLVCTPSPIACGEDRPGKVETKSMHRVCKAWLADASLSSYSGSLRPRREPRSQPTSVRAMRLHGA